MGGLGVKDEGGIAKSLWVKSRNQSTLAIYTPYVLSLASGKLDTVSFLHCISQDLLFLQATAQAFEMAEECADDDDDKTVIRKIRKRVSTKLTMFRSIVQEWGFELPAGNISDRAMVKYTDFLLATASGKAVGEKFLGKVATPFEKSKLAAYTLAVIVPSLRNRASLSKELQAILEPDENIHLYKKWIDSFASQKFEASASQIEELLDKLTASLTGEELEVVEKLYCQALKLEVGFFSSQPIVRNTIVPLSRAHGDDRHDLALFSGFDMTCSAVDSFALLAEIGIIKSSKAKSSNGYDTARNGVQVENLRTIWSTLHDQYVKEYEQCIDNIMLREKVSGFNFEILCNALGQLSDMEKATNTKVVQSGVLKGLCLDDIKWAGEHLVFQDGCREFFREIAKSSDLGIDAHILSYCWSGDLIRFAFWSGDLKTPNVHSNELLYNGSVSTGEILKRVQCPKEKLQAFNEISKSSSNNGKKLSVFVGGSVGDLLCLLKADIGIVISPSENLKRLGNLFGFSFVPLFSGLVTKQREFIEGGSQCWKGLSGTLYTVSSWAEIHAFILGV